MPSYKRDVQNPVWNNCVLVLFNMDSVLCKYWKLHFQNQVSREITHSAMDEHPHGFTVPARGERLQQTL